MSSVSSLQFVIKWPDCLHRKHKSIALQISLCTASFCSLLRSIWM
jgi:hypothetical protein